MDDDIFAGSDENWQRERDLDRSFEREPSFGRDRRRIPLHEEGALKRYFAGKKVKP